MDIGHNHNYFGDARINGLPPAIANGQPLTYEQLGGSVLMEQATLNLPSQVQTHEQTVARPETLATQQIKVWLAPTLDTDDNDLWQLESVNIDAQCATDQVTFFFSSLYFESGDIKINYEVR
jgi:hypothetical protein